MSRFTAPVRVSIDLTYVCDLRCIHCRTNTGEVPAHILRQMMSVPTIVQLVRDLDSLGTFEITFTGGEPTIHPDFWTIVEAATGLRYASITLITNGVSLTTEKMRRLFELGIHSIRVSVDGTREVFARVRKRDVFDRVMENCLFLQEHAPNFKVLTTVMTENFDDVFELVQYLWRAGIKRQDLILVRSHGRGFRNGLTLSREQVYEVQRRTQEFQAAVHRSEFDLNLNAPYLSPEPEDRIVYDVVMYPYLAEDASLAISATGDVTMSRLYSPSPIGNVKQQTISEIWSTGQARLVEEKSRLDPDELREIFWGFDQGSSKSRSRYSALLDRQIFEGYEVQ